MKSTKKPVEVTLTVTLSKEEYEAIYNNAKNTEWGKSWKDEKHLLVQQELVNSVYSSINKKAKGCTRPEERMKPLELLEDGYMGEDAYEYYYFLDEEGKERLNALKRLSPDC